MNYQEYEKAKKESVRNPILLVTYDERRGVSSDPNTKMREFRVSVVHNCPENPGSPINYGNHSYQDTKYKLDFDNILIRAWGFDRNDMDGNDKYGVWGFELEYYSPLSVDLRRSERMLKTLKNIQRKLDNYRQEFGDANSFDSYLMRIAKAIGSKEVWVKGKKTSSAWGYAGYEYHKYSVADTNLALHKAKAVYESGFATR